MWNDGRRILIFERLQELIGMLGNLLSLLKIQLTGKIRDFNYFPRSKFELRITGHTVHLAYVVRRKVQAESGVPLLRETFTTDKRKLLPPGEPLPPHCSI